MTLRLLLGWLALLLLSIPPTARAEGPTVSVTGCSGLEAADLQRLLAIELRTLGPDITAVREVGITCSGEVIDVVAEPAAGGASLRAQLMLRDRERASITRLLALRISELLATPEAAETQAKPAPGAGPVAAAQPAPPPPRTRQRALSLAASVRRMGEPTTWLSGLALAFAAPLLSHLTIRGDLTLELGRTRAQVAELAWRQASLGVALLWTARTRHIALGAGPGFRGAFTWLAAHDVAEGRTGRRLSAPWAGPFVGTRLAVHGQSTWQAVLDLEGGLVVVPVRGLIDDAEVLLSIDGAWLGAQLGAVYRF